MWYREKDNFGFLGDGDKGEKFIGAKKESDKIRGLRAISAASDYYWLEKYNVVALGVHLYTSYNESDFAPRVGYVAAWHRGGEKYPRPQAGWSPIVLVNDQYRLEDFDTNGEEESATLKHDAVEAFAEGWVLKLSLAARRNYWDSFVQKWTHKDQELAKKQQRKWRKEFSDYQYVSGKRFDAQRQRHQGQFKPRKRRLVAPSSITFKVKGDADITMDQLKPGWYRLCNMNGRFICQEEWTGRNGDLWKALSVTYKLEKLPEYLLNLHAVEA